MDLNTTEYNDIIKRIKIKRTIARILIFITAALLILSFPIQLKFNGEIIFDYKGFQSPALFFIIVAFVAELIAHIIICLPIYNSLFEECNAQKNVIMLNALESEKRACHLFYTAYFYLGDFDTSIYYSNKAIESGHNLTSWQDFLTKQDVNFLAIELRILSVLYLNLTAYLPTQNLAKGKQLL